MSGTTLQTPTPPWTKLGKRIESMCRKALYDFEMLDETDTLAVALSGGKDSLTLLFMLHAILGCGFPAKQLVALHVSGAFSCGAGVHRSYLQETCDALGVKLVVEEVEQDPETLECYSCSRRRRSLLFAAAKKHGCSQIAFGHHKEDNVQTLLMNVLHKGEFAGNLPKVPMLQYGITILRPLIYVSERDIVTFSKQEGFARVMCQCPVGQKSLRRKTEELVQALTKVYPNAIDNLSRVSLEHGDTKALRP